jgi:hypothetical protein
MDRLQANNGAGSYPIQPPTNNDHLDVKSAFLEKFPAERILIAAGLLESAFADGNADLAGFLVEHGANPHSCIHSESWLWDESASYSNLSSG